jgi:hypothetical protein
MICINEHTRKVKGYVSLKDNEKFKGGIFTETIGRVPLQRWTHIAFTMSPEKISIFINGIRDGLQMVQNRPFQSNTEDLYIGGSPSYSKTCKLQFFLKNYKVIVV